MATTFRGALKVQLYALLQNALDKSTPEDRVDIFEKWVMANGEAADGAEEIWHDQRAVAFGATDSLDLDGGGLVNGLGTALAFTKVKLIYIKAAAANPNNLEITMPASGIPMFKTAADAVLLGPDDFFLLTRRNAAGIAVGAGATDDINIINPAGSGADCIYDVVLIGTKA